MRRSVGVLTLLLFALVAAGCAGDPTTTWTYPPAGQDPAASPDPASTAAPSAPAATTAPAESAPPAPTSAVTDATYHVVGTKPCPESRFECITLAVPKDHYAAPGGPTWDVTFAIQRAAKERKGTFVVIVGGPGGSGIASADGYTDYYDASITDAYDIVFIDQRGIGLSEPIQCIDAAAAFYGDPNRVKVPAERPAAAAAAQTFAADCIAEAGIAEADLPLYASRQAIHDLEAIRDYLDVDQLHLYGESYGTQFVQAYAAAYPDRVAALFVDGPVDLTIDGIDYYVETTRSAEDTLVAVLAACTADATCAGDVDGGDALAVYDALAASLATAPIPFDFPMSDGTVQRRSLTSTDLENAGYGYIFSTADRESLQRAIAAASHDNLVPLARLAYGSIGLDPETLKAEEDPTWSDAMYYAVECQDYAFYPDGADPDARLAAWVAAGAEAGIDDLRLGTSFYGDTPCLYWPNVTAPAERPAPLLDVPYPVFVLTSTNDPATAIANGYRIYGRLDDAWFFQTLGGPHVIFGWGEPCPDTEIAAYLANDELPAARITTCAGSIADDYVNVAPPQAGAFDDALTLMQSMDDQLLNTEDYLSRLDDEPIAAGCDFGGSLTYALTDSGTKITLDACEFTDGLPISGTGTVDDDAGTFALDATVAGDALRYRRNGDGDTSVTGTFRGKSVDLEEAA